MKHKGKFLVMALIPIDERFEADPNLLEEVPSSNPNRPQLLKWPVSDIARDIEADARALGYEAPLFTVRSGYRPTATQEALWQQALKKYGSSSEARKYVAPPGRSSHMTGQAIDFDLGYSLKSENIDAINNSDAYATMLALGDKYGLSQYHREPWHWECDSQCEADYLSKKGEKSSFKRVAKATITIGLVGLFLYGFKTVYFSK